MLIYTSYFAQVRNLPSGIVPISITAKQVPGWRYPVYKALAPTYNILYDYKRDGDKDHYVAAYLRDVLRHLSPEKVVADLSLKNFLRIHHWCIISPINREEQSSRLDL